VAGWRIGGIDISQHGVNDDGGKEEAEKKEPQWFETRL